MKHTRQARHTTAVATSSQRARSFDGSGYLERLMAELDRAGICARIAQAREEAGLTQPELADLLAVHYRTVQTWESMRLPRVPWDRLDEIARVTGKTKEWLLHGDTEEDAIRRDEADEWPAVLGRLDDLEAETAENSKLLSEQRSLLAEVLRLLRGGQAASE